MGASEETQNLTYTYMISVSGMLNLQHSVVSALVQAEQHVLSPAPCGEFATGRHVPACKRAFRAQEIKSPSSCEELPL